MCQESNLTFARIIESVESVDIVLRGRSSEKGIDQVSYSHKRATLIWSSRQTSLVHFTVTHTMSEFNSSDDSIDSSFIFIGEEQSEVRSTSDATFP